MLLCWARLVRLEEETECRSSTRVQRPGSATRDAAQPLPVDDRLTQKVHRSMGRAKTYIYIYILVGKDLPQLVFQGDGSQV